jgi:hypothetical protein
MKTLCIEGVPYHRYRVRYRLANGKRRTMIRWSPGAPWVFDEIGRELIERYGADGIAPRSVLIRLCEVSQ